MANYTRYSPADWSSSNMNHYNSADNSRNNSERIRNEAVRLMRDRDEKTVLTQRDADRRLGERLHDVTFWRSELQVSGVPHECIHVPNERNLLIISDGAGKEFE